MSDGPAVQGGGRPLRYLESQHFEGAAHISANTLASVTGLNKGDALSPETVNAARRAILDLYATSVPGPAPSLKCKMQTTIEGKVTLTWIIGEMN
jgi:outer membrane protein assembly factor BamA